MVDKNARRRYSRRALAVELVARDRKDSEAGELAFDAVDISEGGAFLRSELLLEVGEELEVRFRLPALKEDTESTTTVRWNKPDGIGVQFGSLRALEVWGLNQLFKTLTKAAPE